MKDNHIILPKKVILGVFKNGYIKIELLYEFLILLAQEEIS